MVLKQSIDDVLIGRDDGAERLMQRLPHAIPKPRRTHQDRPNGSGVSRQGTGKGLPACGGRPVAGHYGSSQTPTPDAGKKLLVGQREPAIERIRIKDIDLRAAPRDNDSGGIGEGVGV